MRKPAGIERCNQVICDCHCAAGEIDECRALLHCGETLGVQKTARRIGKRHEADENVALFQQCLQPVIAGQRFHAIDRLGRTAPASDVESGMGEALRRSRAERPEAEETDGHFAGVAVIQLLPERLFLVFAIGGHIALQIIGPCQHGFGHHTRKLRIFQPNDGRSLFAQFQHQPLDTCPQAVDPFEARKRRDIGRIRIGDDGEIHLVFLFRAQFGKGKNVLFRHGGAQRLLPDGLRFRIHPRNKGYG